MQAAAEVESLQMFSWLLYTRLLFLPLLAKIGRRDEPSDTEDAARVGASLGFSVE